MTMNAIRLNIIILGFGVALIATFCMEANSVPLRSQIIWPHLTLFEHENHQGKKYHQEVGVGRCYNLPKVFDDEASSLHTHHRCVKVCKERECKKCVRMEPGSAGHFALKDVGLNDHISSFTHC